MGSGEGRIARVWPVVKGLAGETVRDPRAGMAADMVSRRGLSINSGTDPD